MATYPIVCGSCNQGVAAEVIHTDDSSGRSTLWLQCPICTEGSVKVRHGAVYPTAPAGGLVGNLPPDVEDAWREARTSHAVAAYTCAEIMCRKILMHVAVDQTGSKPGARFIEYIDHLEAGHHFPPNLKPVVDKVRQRGNLANHGLPASTESDSLTTMAITEHLLRGIYELPHL